MFFKNTVFKNTFVKNRYCRNHLLQNKIYNEKTNKRAAAFLAVLSVCLLFFPSCRTSSNSQPVANNNNDTVIYTSIKTAPQSAISVSAESAILIEASSGEIIWQKNAESKHSMASTTKIMTALVALENCELDRMVKVSPDAVGVEGSSIYLYAGETLSMENLLYALLLSSANDAAAAIAIEVGGSIEAFAGLMNQKADELNLECTHFSNPHGLDDPEHYTTAKDLAKIAMAAMQNETFRQIVSTYKKTIPHDQTDGVRLLLNHNKLLKNYEGAIGIKTGFTKKSGRCLVSAATRDGLELIAVTINAPDDWNDHKEMLDFGFSGYECKTLCTQNELKFNIPVVGGYNNYVIATNRETIKIIVPRNSTPVKTVTECPKFLYAPARQGDQTGSVIYYFNGIEIGRSNLIIVNGTEETSNKRSLAEILGIKKQ